MLNPSDHTYSCDDDDLNPDLNVLWLSRQLCPTEVLRAAIDPLRQLPLAQAENLITRLANATQLRPRLAVPFLLWGGFCSQLIIRSRIISINPPLR